LGSLMDGPPWNEVMIRHWDDFLAPWLQMHGSKAEARHMLHMGLGREETALRLVPSALAWLEDFATEPNAQFVLAPLLGRTHLGDHAPDALDFAMGWLKRFSVVPEARFVLYPLLGRADLGDRAPAALDF